MQRRLDRLHAALWVPSSGSDGPPRLRRQAVYPLLAAVTVVLGVNWPVMHIALRSVPAVWMAVFRLLAAAISVLVVAVATGRIERPPRHDYPVVASVALVRLALVFTLIFLGLEIVPPGRSSILVWTASLWTVPLAVVVVGERMSRVRWAGLATGIGGIVLVFDPARLDWSDGRVIVGHALLLGASVGTAAVSVHIRYHRWVSTPMALLPWQLGLATVPIAVVAFAVEGVPSVEWSAGLVANIMFQGAVVSGFAIWGQMTILRSHPAISTNLALMAVPVIGLLSSAVLVDERLGLAVLGGLSLVVVGVGMSRFADAREARSPHRAQ